MKLTLIRYAYLPECTLGWLTAPAADLRLATIERPWLRNPDGPGGTSRASCVPDGRYVLRPHHSDKFPGTYAIENEALGVYYQYRPQNQTWGRTAILIHKGNFVRDVIGCIAIGSRPARPNGEHAVVESGVALDRLRAILGRSDRHELGIMPTPGTV